MNTTENKKQPLVSVIITTYHNEAYLSRAVESVLHQTYPAVELIVVDDNQPGTDERRATEAVMEKYPRAVYLKTATERRQEIRGFGRRKENISRFWTMMTSISALTLPAVCGNWRIIRTAERFCAAL